MDSVRTGGDGRIACRWDSLDDNSARMPSNSWGMATELCMPRGQRLTPERLDRRSLANSALFMGLPYGLGPENWAAPRQGCERLDGRRPGAPVNPRSSTSPPDAAENVRGFANCCPAIPDMRKGRLLA